MTAQAAGRHNAPQGMKEREDTLQPGEARSQ
jgi:hypothetical protein